MDRKLLLNLAWLSRLILVTAAMVNAWVGNIDIAIFSMLVAIYFQLGDN